MDGRTSYRDSIVLRKEKEKGLTDMLQAEKIDVAALQNAIDAARANGVKETIIQTACKKLDWLKYSKEVEQLLIQAMAEKVKENLMAMIERVEKEQITIEPKMLNDAKNIYSKLK